jgi:hypothetical protein
MPLMLEPLLGSYEPYELAWNHDGARLLCVSVRGAVQLCIYGIQEWQLSRPWVWLTGGHMIARPAALLGLGCRAAGRSLYPPPLLLLSLQS